MYRFMYFKIYIVALQLLHLILMLWGLCYKIQVWFYRNKAINNMTLLKRIEQILSCGMQFFKFILECRYIMLAIIVLYLFLKIVTLLSRAYWFHSFFKALSWKFIKYNEISGKDVLFFSKKYFGIPAFVSFHSIFSIFKIICS